MNFRARIIRPRIVYKITFHNFAKPHLITLIAAARQKAGFAKGAVRHMFSVVSSNPGVARITPLTVGKPEILTLFPGVVAVVGRGVWAAPAKYDVSLTFEHSADCSPALLRVGQSTGIATHFSGRNVAIEMSANPASDFFGGGLTVGACYHLSTEMRLLLTSLSDCVMKGAARRAYVTGTALQLLAAAADSLERKSLVPLAGPSRLTPADSKRVMLAQEMIDERWADKLTLDQIARDCGLNRFKLTQGFRDLFRTSIHQALSERRFAEACKLLRSTDMHVSLVAYEVGYSNAASFTRAFGKRFGIPPSAVRDMGAHPASRPSPSATG